MKMLGCFAVLLSKAVPFVGTFCLVHLLTTVHLPPEITFSHITNSHFCVLVCAVTHLLIRQIDISTVRFIFLLIDVNVAV